MWNLTLKGKNKLQVAENERLIKVSGPKKREVKEQPRILYNETPCDLYRSPSIVKIVI